MKKKGDSLETSMPRFFRIFKKQSCQKHMELPLAFKRFLAKPLPEKVTIRNQHGDNWSITMKSVKNKVFLEDGWKNFAKKSELKHGSCLIFNYDGDNAFDVTIFDCSALEKINSSLQTMEINNIEEIDDIEEIDSDDNDDDDDEQEEADDEREKQIPKSQGRKLEGSQNPSFIINVTGKRTSELRIPSYVVKDYNLKFNNSVILIDSIGRLKRKVTKWRDNRIIIKSFGSIISRNYAKPNDKLICDIITENKVWVGAIKIRPIHHV